MEFVQLRLALLATGLALALSACNQSTSDASASQTNSGIPTASTVGETAAGSVALLSASYAVAQNAGSVVITVKRTGGSSGAVSVAYATSNGTAVAGAVYTTASGTLQWADGDSSPKTFEVPISDATPFQGVKSFTADIFDATGGVTFGTPSHTTVTIVGNGSTAPGSSLSGTSGGAPTNVEVILQGQTLPYGTSIDASPCCALVGTYRNANNNEIGWRSVTNATQYNIYRATNGGSYSEIASVSDSTASTNYSDLATLFNDTECQGGTTCQIAPGINRAWLDATADNVVGTALGAKLSVVGNTTSGSTTLNVTSVSTGSLTVGQGIGGPGIAPGATIASEGTGTGGPGTYTMSEAATATKTGQTYGAVYFADQGYTYYVTAVVGGVESAASAYAILPYVVNGQFICSAGVFNGTVVTGATAPATTPLGYSNALEWQQSSTNYALINTYAGNSCASFNASIAGYNYVVFSIYNPRANVSMQVNTEIAGDGELSGTLQLSNWGPATLNVNGWTTYKIPLCGSFYIDAQYGDTKACQTAFYKATWQLTAQPTTSYNDYVEIYFSVN